MKESGLFQPPAPPSCPPPPGSTSPHSPRTPRSVLPSCGVREDWGGSSGEMRREEGREVRLAPCAPTSLTVKIKISWLCWLTGSNPESWRSWKSCLEVGSRSREAEAGRGRFGEEPGKASQAWKEPWASQWTLRLGGPRG